MKKLIVLIIILGAGSLAWGQQKHAITFDEALEITLTNNPEIKALDYEEEMAKREKKAAFGLRLPTISTTGAYAYMEKDIAFDLNSLKEPVGGILEGLAGSPIGGYLPPEILQEAQALLGRKWDLTLQERSMGTVGGTISVPVFTGGKINAANNAAKIKMEEAAAKGDQGRNALISELTERYYGLSLALQVTEVRRQVLEGMQKHLYDARELEKNGMIAKAERLNAEVYTAEAERELLKAQRQAATLNNALSNTLNTIGEYAPSSNMFILQNIESVEYFKEQAQESSPLLKQVSLKHDLAKVGVKLQRADFFPQVALMGTGSLYNYQVTKLMPRWAVGAGITFKLFDGLNREYKFSAAKSQVKQVEALGESANNNILTLIEKLYNELMTYRDQMPSIDASEKFAEEYLRMRVEAFREGVGSSSDVVDAQLNLAKIKTERLQAAYYYDLMLAKLLEASGLSSELTAYSKRPSATPVRYE